MKNFGVKWLALAGAAMLVAGSLAGCGTTAGGETPEETNAETAVPEEAGAAAEEQSQEDTSSEAQAQGEGETPEPEGASDLSGGLGMAGSTSMEKLANALAESFMAKYPGVTVTAEFTGSSAGVESLLSGSVDIGNSSRALKDSEKENGAVENVVAIDGIAVVTDPANEAGDLTKEQLSGIYTGAITNWKELGGADQPLVVIGREAGSGTRGAFEEILGIEDKCVYAGELDSTGAVMAKVASTPGAIGYVSLDVVNDTVKTLSLEGVAATADNIKAGSYFLSRPFVMATRGEISEQSELVQEFFRYLTSEEGQKVITNVGLILPE